MLVPVFDIDRVGALNDADGPNGIQFRRSRVGDDVTSGQEGRFVHSLRFIVPRPERAAPQPKALVTKRRNASNTRKTPAEVRLMGQLGSDAQRSPYLQSFFE